MTLDQGNDTPLGHWQQLCVTLSRSKFAVRSHGQNKNFQYMCTLTLTFEIWPWVKVMTHHWVMNNNCVQFYPDQNLQWGVMAWTSIFGICALWPWPKRYDLGSRKWHTLGSWTTIVWNVIKIQLGSEELWPGHGFWECVHCDLEFGDMTFGQGHNTPLGHWKQLCVILSWSKLAVRSYGPDMDFGYVCTVLWPWPYDLGSRPWNNFESWTTIVWNIIQIGQVGKQIWPRHNVNRQIDRAIPIYPQTLFAGGVLINQFMLIRTIKLTWADTHHRQDLHPPMQPTSPCSMLAGVANIQYHMSALFCFCLFESL